MLLTGLIFFLILSILVFIHELGHFLTAKWIGVGVLEFGFGLPPRIWGLKWKGTLYSINWLPIGGFVKLAGEDDEHESVAGKHPAAKLKTFFWARSKKERAAILVAGVFMNFVLAVGITAYLLVGGVAEPSGRVRVETVVEGSPAAQAGLMPQDIIDQVAFTAQDGTRESKYIATPAELIAITNAHKGVPLSLTIVRAEVEQIVTIIPRVDVPAGQGPLGVSISDLEVRKYSSTEALPKAFTINLVRAKEMVVALSSAVWGLVAFRPMQADIAGPIGIAQVTGQAVKYGFTAVLEFMSILSLNLAILNILPFPALDGGRLAFVFLEKVLGKKVKPAFERSTHQIGMLILFALILLVSLNDILRLTRGGI